MKRLLLIGMAGLFLLSSHESVIADASGPVFDRKAAEQEIKRHYGKAHPEVQEFLWHTVEGFGPDGMWLNEGAFDGLSTTDREEKVKYVATLLSEGEYGRHLCKGLAAAGALKDERLLPGLMKVAGYQKEGVDYDCRPKWMAVAALARQESRDSIPLLISLVDHGNMNTRMWSQAALTRITSQSFGKDKEAWNKWWDSERTK